jgi:hypothetical protein
MSYERRDASLALIGTSAGILLVLLFGSILGSAWYFRGLSAPSRHFPRAGRQSSFTFGFEREPDVLRSWRATMADAGRRLESYGWVDHPAGIARIPIERAMKLVAAGERAAAFPASNPADPVEAAAVLQTRTPMPSR